MFENFMKIPSQCSISKIMQTKCFFIDNHTPEGAISFFSRYIKKNLESKFIYYVILKIPEVSLAILKGFGCA